MNYLVENSLFGADEAPLEDLFGTIGQIDRVTDVEELAFVVNVSVITIDLAFARESVHYVVANGRRVAW
jgi:hypothetical protein